MPDYENTPVETNVAPDMNAPAADGQEAVEEVVISAESPATAPSETGSNKTVVNPPADGAQVSSQKDIDKAFGQRLAQERRKYEQSDAYQLGQMLLNERAKRDGITPAEAYQRIQQERLDATAEAYAKDPKQFYKDLLNNNLRSTPNPQTDTPDAQAERVGREIAAMQQRGQLPAGFDFSKLDQDTYNNIVEYGAPAAMRIWQAEHSVNAELQRRQAGPAPMRPTSGASQQSAPTDFSKMSSEDFFKKRAEIRKASIDGKRVRLS